MNNHCESSNPHPGTWCDFCRRPAGIFLVGEAWGFEPKAGDPSVCSSCFDTLYWVLEGLPDDGGELNDVLD